MINPILYFNELLLILICYILVFFLATTLDPIFIPAIILNIWILTKHSTIINKEIQYHENIRTDIRSDS